MHLDEMGKAPEANSQAFDAALPDEPDVERRSSFGCPAKSRSSDVQFLTPWLRRAYEYGGGLAPKPPKKKAVRKKAR